LHHIKVISIDKTHFVLESLVFWKKSELISFVEYLSWITFNVSSNDVLVGHFSLVDERTQAQRLGKLIQT
jgi:hypothetical protein